MLNLIEMSKGSTLPLNSRRRGYFGPINVFVGCAKSVKVELDLELIF